MINMLINYHFCATLTISLIQRFFFFKGDKRSDRDFIDYYRISH